MFGLLFALGVVIGFLSLMAIMFGSEDNSSFLKSIGMFGIIIAISLLLSAFMTASGKMQITKMMAGASNGSWLVIDNSGGETLRHWVITEGYVESSDQSDGWQFRDSQGNLCYVSGDAFVMRVTEPIEEFKKNYKESYNIPTSQEPLK